MIEAVEDDYRKLNVIDRMVCDSPYNPGNSMTASIVAVSSKAPRTPGARWLIVETIECGEEECDECGERSTICVPLDRVEWLVAALLTAKAMVSRG